MSKDYQKEIEALVSIFQNTVREAVIKAFEVGRHSMLQEFSTEKAAIAALEKRYEETNCGAV